MSVTLVHVGKRSASVIGGRPVEVAGVAVSVAVTTAVAVSTTPSVDAGLLAVCEIVRVESVVVVTVTTTIALFPSSVATALASVDVGEISGPVDAEADVLPTNVRSEVKVKYYPICLR